MRYLLIALLAVTLASCSGGRSGSNAPRNLDDACSIKQQRKDWFKDMSRAERKWGVPISVMMSTIYHESKFDGAARTPLVFAAGIVPMGRRSSAFGYAQAIDSTWEWYQDDTGRRRAKRTDFADAVDFMGWYMNKSREKNGISLNDPYNQYLAYHDGHAGYARGSYRSKAWLPPVARRVEERAIMYHAQLQQCRR